MRKEMGKYHDLLEDINSMDHKGNKQSLEVSLKILDTLNENTSELPVSQAFIILDDAKDLLLQIVGIN